MADRILGLEFLRGACAVLVAVYHCAYWAGLAYMPSWGSYGVYIFFSISGAVLYQNYSNGIAIADFLWRRFARLVPLYGLCTIMMAVAAGEFGFNHLLNVSLLFGFANPGQTSVVAGGWSLGIEFVFYALFPVLLAFTPSIKVAIGAFVTFFVLRVAFVEAVLDGSTLAQAWNDYTQPAAFLVFFFGGMVVGRFSAHVEGRRSLLLPGIACLVALFALPNADLTGFPGMALALLTVMVVGCFFWSPISRAMGALCLFFGEISYGLYLLHPFVWAAMKRVMEPSWFAVAITIALASIAAWLVLRFYETPAKRWILSAAPRRRLAS